MSSRPKRAPGALGRNKSSLGATVALLPHASRGPHPGDAKWFRFPQLARLREAAHDVTWLLDRGYPRESAVRFVGDRHQLAARQRLALMRGICSEAERRGRATSEERVEEVSQDLRDLEGLDPDLIPKLESGGVHTRDDLADLAVDELVELTGIDAEAAKTLIMKAREHWFAAEAAAQENAASATADAETPQETTTQG